MRAKAIPLRSIPASFDGLDYQQAFDGYRQCTWNNSGKGKKNNQLSVARLGRIPAAVLGLAYSLFSTSLTVAKSLFRRDRLPILLPEDVVMDGVRLAHQIGP